MPQDRTDQDRARRRRTPAAPAPAVTPVRSAAVRELETVVGDCAVYTAKGRTPGRLTLAQATEQTEGFTWIGLQEPTAQEFEAIAERFGLPPLAVQDAVHAHQRPKLDLYDEVAFVVLKPVRYLDSDEVIESSELAVFVGGDFVVTVRHGASDVLRRVRTEYDQAHVGDALLGHGPFGVLYRALDLAVDAYEEVAHAIDNDVDEIEEQVFGGDVDDHTQRIYKLKREVLEFRRAVVPLAGPLERLSDGQVPGVPEALLPYFRDVQDHALRAADLIESHDRMLTDVLSADLAQISVRQNHIAVRQNEDVRKITAWAAIALVPTAIAGVYGMNFENMPELKWEYGYFMVLGLILSVCAGLYLLFRRRDWL